MCNSDATLNEEERYLDDFQYIPKEIQKQMILHLRALILSFLNQETNWAWNHPKGVHALSTEKALLSLKLVRKFE